MMDDVIQRCASCSASDTPRADAKRDGIARRTFLAQSAVIAAAVALAACGASGDSPTSPTLTGTTTLKLSDYPVLNGVGGIALVTISSAPFAVVRTGASSFVTLSRVCTHEGTTVNVNGSGFLCPNHGAQFNASGTWIGGQVTTSLHSYPTVYDATAGTLTLG
jgi:cytochrome b6-f complex iron-sulfur subunit